MAEDNKYYVSVDGVLFSGDMSELISYPALKEGRSYSVPYGVRVLSATAFRNAENLSELEIPRSLSVMNSAQWDGVPTFRGSSIENFIVDKRNSKYFAENGVLYDASGKTLIYYPSGRTDTSLKCHPV